MDKPEEYPTGPNMCDLDNCITAIGEMIIKNNGDQGAIGFSKQVDFSKVQDEDFWNSYNDDPFNPQS
jgi:hypothetical protein